METILLIFVIFLCVLLEYLTLHNILSKLYTNSNSILLTNWKLVSVYLLAAVLLFPLTLLSTIFGRSRWESELRRSAQNNLFKGYHE